MPEPVETEQQEPEKQDVPEQSQSESAESSKSQVCNAHTTVQYRLFSIHSTVQKGIYMYITLHYTAVFL